MTLYPTRTVLILLAGASLGACSSYAPFEGDSSAMARPAYAINARSAQAAAQPTAQAAAAPSQDPPHIDPPPPARQAAPEMVEARPLDAPAARRDEPAAALPPAAPAATFAAAAPVRTPAATMVTRTTVTGRVVDAEGPARTHIVKKGDNLDAIARELGVTRQELAEQNGLKPPYRLHPGDSLTGPSTEAKAYVVGQGDTLFAVAKRFSVTAQALADANDVETNTRLAPGRKLILPTGFRDKGPTRTAGTMATTDYNPTAPAGRTESAPAEAAPERTASRTAVTGKVVSVTGKAGAYKVKKGDTVESLADDFDMTQKELIAANGLKRPYHLRIGQVLKGPPEEHKAYVPVEGDTLALIARRFSVSASALADANDMDTTDRVTPGHKLTLPNGVRDKGPVKVAGVAAAPAESPPTRAGRRGRAESTSVPTEEPSERTTTRAEVTGKVVTVTGGPTSYKVRRGETVESIADKLDIEQRELIKTNKLKAPYRLRAGQVLKGPPEEYKAYVPVEGDTLALIARRFGVTPKALAAENDMRATAEVRPGRKLALPDGFHDKGPIRETVRAAPETTYSRPDIGTTRTPSTPQPYNPGPQPYNPTPQPYIPSRPQPYAAPPTRPTTPPPSTSPSGALSDAQISTLGRGRFIWPLNGSADVTSDFGPKGTGKRNDGIDIHANAGDMVHAAADGDVVYAGDQVPGFGNLVLVRHADGWVTAYGNLARVDVKMQQKVVQGQQLGPAGQTGGVSSPQLHFEVRYAPSPTERARPVDPKLVLPR